MHDAGDNASKLGMKSGIVWTSVQTRELVELRLIQTARVDARQRLNEPLCIGCEHALA
jgi:hypothetical protein